MSVAKNPTERRQMSKHYLENLSGKRYKELLCLTTDRKQNPIRKWAKDLNKIKSYQND